MKSRHKHMLAALVSAAVLTSSGTALAQQQVDDRRTVSANVQVEIEDIIVGSVRVIGTDSNEMTVTGTIGPDVDEFVIEGGPEYVEIYVEFEDWDDDHNDGNRRRWRGRERHDVDVDLEIHVPRGATLDIEGVTASFTVENVDGNIEIESVTGDIVYSGNASMIELNNVTGSVTATAGNPMEVDIESVNGHVTYTGSVGPQGEISIENVNGSIDLFVPGSIDATFYIETMMGGIENDFGQEPERESRWVPSQELRFRNGSGSGEVHVETLQGGVNIRRQ
ncbi:MAG: hypothetical protein GKS06_08455 [Acidobacteria bacterium]|nr:hypothetical protein [Acidobacteriota bacterium]